MSDDFRKTIAAQLKESAKVLTAVAKLSPVIDAAPARNRFALRTSALAARSSSGCLATLTSLIRFSVSDHRRGFGVGL